MFVVIIIFKIETKTKRVEYEREFAPSETSNYINREVSSGLKLSIELDVFIAFETCRFDLFGGELHNMFKLCFIW
jgi:hypothetical protein